MKDQSCCNCFHWLYVLGSWIQPVFLLVIRLFWGFALLMIGVGKFAAMNKVAAFFMSLGIPWPEYSAYFVASIEVVAGALLILGLASRFAGLLISIVMVAALLTAHAEATYGIILYPSLFIAQEPVTFLLVGLTIFCFGAGGLSLDRLIYKRCCK